MYGLVSISVISLRYRERDWYNPSFRAPLFPLVSVIGAGASFFLVAFMEPRVIGNGLIIVFAAFLWYILVIRRRKR
jgi:amino acid transporter